MEKSEFSEIQFVIGYLRELLNSLIFPHTIYLPSTREEKQSASDFILNYYNRLGKFRYSEFYQFKRSKFYNSEIFDSLKGGFTIDTSTAHKYGFSIYNSKKTKQFNVLQKLALDPKSRVFYCAPIFHTINEFNNYFNTRSIVNNSKLIPFSQREIQSVRIPLNSNHKIIFDRSSQHLCSDPIELEGYLASERDSKFEDSAPFSGVTFEDEITRIHKLVISEIFESRLVERFETPPINFFEVNEMLITYFNIFWIPNISM